MESNPTDLIAAGSTWPSQAGLLKIEEPHTYSGSKMTEIWMSEKLQDNPICPIFPQQELDARVNREAND